MRRLGFWAWHPLYKRIPDKYYRHLMELEKPSERVHDYEEKGDLLDYYVADPKTLRIERRPDVPIRVEKLEQSDKGLWAGEGLIKGFMHPRRRMLIPFGARRIKIWLPNLYRAKIYSEILDTYLSIVVTSRTMRKIDEAYGFDNYILRTPIQDLKSKLGLDLRRKMLTVLAKGLHYPDDPEKHKIIHERYKDCILPMEEIEWIGLSIPEAIRKQIQEDRLANKPRPLKLKYVEQLISKLDDLKEKGELTISKEERDKNIWSKLKSLF